MFADAYLYCTRNGSWTVGSGADVEQGNGSGPLRALARTSTLPRWGGMGWGWNWDPQSKTMWDGRDPNDALVDSPVEENDKLAQDAILRWRVLCKAIEREATHTRATAVDHGRSRTGLRRASLQALIVRRKVLTDSGAWNYEANWTEDRLDAWYNVLPTPWQLTRLATIFAALAHRELQKSHVDCTSANAKGLPCIRCSSTSGFSDEDIAHTLDNTPPCWAQDCNRGNRPVARAYRQRGHGASVRALLLELGTCGDCAGAQSAQRAEHLL